jgi:hypothetical protein
MLLNYRLRNEKLTINNRASNGDGENKVWPISMWDVG